MQQSLAQAVKVIDNKGTIYTIRNNKVTTATSAPTIPVEGDVWIDTSGTSTISKIFDDVNGWIIIDLDNVITNTTAPTTKNIGDVWFDTTTKLTKVFNGTNWIELGGTNTTFEVLGTDLQITDSKGTLSVPLSDLAHTGTTGSVFFAGTDGKPTENNSELFLEEKQYQLRGMAILESYQNTGFGNLLLAEAEKLLHQRQVDLLWFNARETAIHFYKKNNFIP